MPISGKNVSVKHNLDINSIVNVNVYVINGTNDHLILRGQVYSLFNKNDLASNKPLYNWYVDNNSIVILRPNDVIT